MSQVTVVGSANMDLVARVERFPAAGETLLGSAFSTFVGGKGANQSAAVARLGGSCRLIGRVGADPFGEAIRRELAAHGVDVSALAVDPEAPTGVALILVDADGQNQIVVAPGANANVVPGQVVGEASVVLVQLEVPDAAVLAAARLGRCVLNPAPARPVPEEVWPGLWVATPNETEASALTGVQVTTPESAVRAGLDLMRRGVENVVVTLGASGCVWVSASGDLHVPAPAVRAVDTTAAGDCFSGALALALAEGHGFESALPWAVRAASLSVTRPGAARSMPSRDEVGPIGN
jgi:ribokinase